MEQVTALRELRAGGAPVVELAALYGINKFTVYNILSGARRTGRTNNRFTLAEVRGMRQMRLDGYSRVEIARKFRICESTLGAILMNRTYFDPAFIPVRINKSGAIMAPRPNDYRG
jgi:DNA-binding CsgD family transcriptional regulator